MTALAELTLLLEPCNYTHIDGKSNAKEAWDALAETFEDKGAGRRVALLKQMVSLKQKDCISMEEYVQKMNVLWSKVKAAKFNIDEDVAGSLLLGGLPAEYRSMTLAIENSGTKITFDYVKNVLLQGTVFGDESGESESALVSKFKGNKNQQQLRSCFKCGSKTHFIRDCPKSQNTQSGQNRNMKKNNKNDRLDRKITYTKELSNLEGFCDADWGSDEETRKSTTGYLYTLQGGAIAWCAKRQKTIALSTT